MKHDMLVPRKSVKTLVIKPKSTRDKSVTFNTSQSGASPSVGQSAIAAATSTSSNAALSALITRTAPKWPAARRRRRQGEISGGNLFSDTFSYTPSESTVGGLAEPPTFAGFTPAASSAIGDESIPSGASPSGADSVGGTGKVDPTTGITLTRPGYYMKPSLAELQALAPSHNSSGPIEVEDFKVGREGYGYVVFEGKTNVRGLNLDEIVHIRRKEICVYPDDDDDVKPSCGEELNKGAFVYLEKTWPIDKSTREAIKDPERLASMRYSDKVERLTAKMGATFIDYEPGSGAWTFKVDHFSKYGLVDEDSDEENAVAKKRQKGEAAAAAAAAAANQQPKPTQASSAFRSYPVTNSNSSHIGRRH
ncbi:nuclear pore complex protein Nup98-Nup96-like [Oscarella lobularis]|uniref:nuclear pore complex protein Nup98-Nup96-like n=1 Tax=Oscarella lobularis TaxID=121494 RepID=UPI003313A1CF